MKQLLSVLMIVFMFGMVISPVEAKCNAACKANETKAKAAFKANKDLTFNWVGENNKGVRDAKADARAYYETVSQTEKEARQRQLALLEQTVREANAQLNLNKLLKDRKIRQGFGVTNK